MGCRVGDVLIIGACIHARLRCPVDVALVQLAVYGTRGVDGAPLVLSVSDHHTPPRFYSDAGTSSRLSSLSASPLALHSEKIRRKPAIMLRIFCARFAGRLDHTVGSSIELANTGGMSLLS